MKRATLVSRLGHAARTIISKRSLLVPVSAAFALTLVQPGIALASSSGEIVEKALAFDTRTENSFTSAALVSPRFVDPAAARSADAYRISYNGTALMLPGASKTVKYVAPKPVQQSAPVFVPATVQLAAAPVSKPAPKPAPAAKAPTDGRTELGDQIAIRWGGKYKAGSFALGNCTWYAANYRDGVDFLGNGGQWYANARAAGYNVGSKPVKDAIFVTSESWSGHVGIVAEVYSDGSFLTKEMNFAGYNVVSSRVIHAGFGSLIGFVY